MDRRYLESGPRLQQSESWLQTLLCRDLCRKVPRSEGTSFRIWIRLAFGSRETCGTDSMEAAADDLCKFYERPIPRRYSRRVHRFGLSRDAYRQLAHIPSADQALSAPKSAVAW